MYNTSTHWQQMHEHKSTIGHPSKEQKGSILLKSDDVMVCVCEAELSFLMHNAP